MASRDVALPLVGMRLEQPLRHDEAEHAVAEELEPLVGAAGVARRGPEARHARMGQRLDETVGPVEDVAEGVGEVARRAGIR
jgi:hypothetical protein